jgi:hypothetical protein
MPIVDVVQPWMDRPPPDSERIREAHDGPRSGLGCSNRLPASTSRGDMGTPSIARAPPSSFARKSIGPSSGLREGRRLREVRAAERDKELAADLVEANDSQAAERGRDGAPSRRLRGPSPAGRRLGRGRRGRGRAGRPRRPAGWRGDQLSGLQAETGPRVAPLPLGGAAPRGAAAGVAGPLRPAARPAAPRGRAGAARVHAVWTRRTWLREALVPGVPDERALPVLLSRKVVLSVVREEAPAPVGGMAPEGGPRARCASARRPHHATPPARDLPQAAGASPRPLAVRRRGRRRVRAPAARCGHSPRNRGLRRHRRGPGPMAPPRTPPDHGWGLLRRRRLSPARELGRRSGDEAVPRTAARPPRRATRDLRGPRTQARRLATSGLLLARRRAPSRTGRLSRTSRATSSGRRSRSRSSSTSTASKLSSTAPA